MAGLVRLAKNNEGRKISHGHAAWRLSDPYRGVTGQVDATATTEESMR